MKMKDKILIAIVIIITVWFAIAQITFALRHPKMTDTERLLRLDDAIFFRRLTDDS
jgi:hypothetical protein